jgi:hypothetical protein
MDSEILTAFEGEKIPMAHKLKVIAKLLQSTDQNISQKSVYALCSPLKEICKTESVQTNKMNVEYGSLLCEAIARAACSTFITSTDREASKHFQHTIATILKFSEALPEPTEGILLALYDIIVNLSSNVQSKHAVEINSIAKKVIHHSEENLALLGGCLLSASIHNVNHFNSLVNSILLAIQRLLNTAYSFVNDNGKKTLNHVTLVPEEGESIIEIKKGTNFRHIFKILTFTLARILSNAYNFQIQVNLEAIVGLIRHTVLLDSNFLKFRESKHNAGLSVNELIKMLPAWHTNALALLNSVVITCKSQLHPFSKQLIDILVQKFKSGQNEYNEFQCVSKSLLVMLSILGSGTSKFILEETLSILVDKVVALYQMSYDVQLSRETTTTEKKLVLDRKVIQFGYLSINALSAIMNTTTTIFLDLVPILTKLVVAILQFIPLVAKLNDAELTEMLPNVYRLLRNSLIYSFLISTSSPFLSNSLQLFRKGVTSSVSRVQEECHLALNILENQLHPRAAPLYLPHSETMERYSLKRSIEDSEGPQKKVKYEENTTQHVDVEDEKFDDDVEEETGNEVNGEDEDEIEEEINGEQSDEIEEDQDAEEEPEVESDIEDDMDQNQIEKSGGIYITNEIHAKITESDIEDDMDEEKTTKSGGLFISKDLLKKVQAFKKSAAKKKSHDVESEEEEETPAPIVTKKSSQPVQKVVKEVKVVEKKVKEIDSDLESIDSDGPDEEKDISNLQLQF